MFIVIRAKNLPKIFMPYIIRLGVVTRGNMGLLMESGPSGPG